MMTDVWRSGGLLVALVIGMTTVFAVAVTRVAAKGEQAGEQFVRNTCTACHRIEGPVAARKTKKAPDLIWAGNKYQPAWLVNWLQNPDFKHYPVGYDFRPDRKKRHLALPLDQAKAAAAFLATRKDPRIKEGVMKAGTAEQMARGRKLYQEHGCQNCHYTPAGTPKGYVGGTSQYLVHQIERAVKRGLGLPF
jgi:mono/diheme cytochrome c family protein